MTHTDTIRMQLEELKAEIRNDPRSIAIRHLTAALAALEGNESSSELRLEEMGTPLTHTVRMETPARRAPIVATKRDNSKIKRIYRIVGAYIDEHGPTHRLVLVNALISSGLMDGLKNPQMVFSTSMSTLKGYFVSDGAGTWQRREGAPEEVIPVWSKQKGSTILPDGSRKGKPGLTTPADSLS